MKNEYKDNMSTLKSKSSNLEITPEIAIDLFGEAARQPICDNLKLYCQRWKERKEELEEIESIIPTIPSVDNAICLRSLYEVILPRLKNQIRQIEHHIERLQKCLELLEGEKIFTEKANLNNYIDVKALKDRLMITDVITKWVDLAPKGKLFKGKCPFHNDRSPSFVVYPDDQRWWCFSCSEGGDVITFVQRINGLTFTETIAELHSL